MYHPYPPQAQYSHQNLGTAGHRASSSYGYMLYHQPDACMPRDLQVAPPPPPAQAQQPPGVPEVANGGITSVLEYNINHMATFVSWCTFGILKQNCNPTAEFDQLVVLVLFATRLPKSTIIIALEYMNQRYLFRQVGALNEQQIFTVLIVLLILANKFNDDNTFTNRSWCGAAGLAIESINHEEKEWLCEVKWQLNVVNFEDNIRTLEECWSTWLEKYTCKSKQPPIQTAGPAEPSHPSYSSIPSSPLYGSSPIRHPSPAHDSMWTHPQSIWTYTPSYQYPQPIYHQVQPQYVDPGMQGFVGYSNPYYNYMASC